jgi:hypothetical protein
MAISEPDAELWVDVKPHTEWPATDEAAMQDLARGWNDAGAAFLAAGTAAPDGRLVDGWNDGNGATFRDRIAQVRDRFRQDGDAMKRLAWLAQEYGYDIGHTKLEIRRLIEGNDAAYANLNGIFGLFGDQTARQQIVTEIANSINTFLGQMAERIAARGNGEPEVPRPVFTVAPQPQPGETPIPENWRRFEPLPNKMDKTLGSELAEAERLGVRPITPGSLEFDELVNSGEVIKWAVLQDGRLVVVPKIVNGVEISHSVLSRGNPVLAAGEAEIAGGGGKYFGLRIDRHSGHFQPGPERLEIGRDAFRQYGIEFE